MSLTLISLLGAAAPAEQPSVLASLLPLVLMFVLLYFLMLRPQMKRQKEHKKLVASLSKGDEVIAASGLMGRISKVYDDYVAVEVANWKSNDAVEVILQRGSISTVLPKGTLEQLL